MNKYTCPFEFWEVPFSHQMYIKPKQQTTWLLLDNWYNLLVDGWHLYWDLMLDILLVDFDVFGKIEYFIFKKIYPMIINHVAALWRNEWILA